MGVFSCIIHTKDKNLLSKGDVKMCCGGGFFNGAGYVISGLKPKQSIVIQKGMGYPPVPADTEAVVWKVSGMSAIMMDGTLLSCDDGYGVLPKEQIVDTAEPTTHARVIYFRRMIRNKLASMLEPISSLRAQIRFRIVLAKHRLKKRLKTS